MNHQRLLLIGFFLYGLLGVKAQGTKYYTLENQKAVSKYINNVKDSVEIHQAQNDKSLSGFLSSQAVALGLKYLGKLLYNEEKYEATYSVSGKLIQRDFKAIKLNTIDSISFSRYYFDSAFISIERDLIKKNNELKELGKKSKGKGKKILEEQKELEHQKDHLIAEKKKAMKEAKKFLLK